MTYYDNKETRDPAERERELFERLPAQIAHAKANAPAFTRSFADVDPASVTTREALARLPVVRKSELVELQKLARPFGGFAAVRWGRQCHRVFASPGPIYEPESARPDYYRLGAPCFRPESARPTTRLLRSLTCSPTAMRALLRFCAYCWKKRTSKASRSVSPKPL